LLNDASKRWVQAGITLAKDPTARVLCPTNADADLVVYDIDLGPTHIERVFTCPKCGARNFMRMTRPRELP
jgi:hypothetical protein